MITLIILAVLCGLLVLGLMGVGAILIDPIIAILAIVGLYKLVSWLFRKK